MSAKKDIQEGITAEVAASRDIVANACRGAVEALGKHAVMESNSAQCTVTILPGLSQKLSSHSPVVFVKLAPATEGRIHIETSIGPYRTIQTKYLGFIPLGPKRLVGRSMFFKFLSEFEARLRAVDPNGAITRRHAV